MTDTDEPAANPELTEEELNSLREYMFGERADRILDRLLAELRRLREENARLREKLKPIGYHDVWEYYKDDEDDDSDDDFNKFFYDKTMKGVYGYDDNNNNHD